MGKEESEGRVTTKELSIIDALAKLQIAIALYLGVSDGIKEITLDSMLKLKIMQELPPGQYNLLRLHSHRIRIKFKRKD